MSENINGYQLKTDFSSAKAGRGLWAIANSDGKQFFIKKFRKPAYIISDNAKLKASHNPVCDEFLSEKKKVLDKIKPISVSNDAIVTHVDFFRDKAHIYSVNELIEGNNDALIDDNFKLIDRLKVCRDIASGMHDFHDNGIIHGDIKFDNIMLRNIGSEIKGVLIDYEDSYLEKEVPDFENKKNPYLSIISDDSFSAPELRNFAKNFKITPAVDIYSFGILMLCLISGKYPDRINKYPHYSWNKKIHAKSFNDFCSTCFSEKPTSRPTSFEALSFLDDYINCFSQKGISYFSWIPDVPKFSILEIESSINKVIEKAKAGYDSYKQESESKEPSDIKSTPKESPSTPIVSFDSSGNYSEKKKNAEPPSIAKVNFELIDLDKKEKNPNWLKEEVENIPKFKK